ncbi:MAG: Cobalt/zinc/cadmium efflux transporter [Ramlibacter sp.]|nr:Cobalt/zinc/cadmium efflux transporter [Ramlibacter sp.]
MEHRKKGIFIAVGVLAVAATSWYLLSARAGSAKPAADASAPAPEPLALVATQAPTRQQLPVQIIGYGEVTTGQIDAVSFPRAGQVSRLLVTVGQPVARGTPLATLATDPNVLTAFQQAVNAVSFAQRELGRIQELYDLKLATQSQLDGAHKALQDAESSLATQRKLGGAIESGTVWAPFDGIVTAVPVSLGDRIQAGATILQLGHADALRVQLGLEPSEARLVRKGMAATVTALQDQAPDVAGSVALVKELLDPKTQLSDVIVVLAPGAGRVLVPGSRVRASIATGHQQGWALPRQAVLSDDQGSYVFQVANGRAHRVQVVQQQESGRLVGVSGPVDAGLPVVVLGNYELQDGMKVREGTR